jgi:hypothetical protein
VKGGGIHERLKKAAWQNNPGTRKSIADCQEQAQSIYLIYVTEKGHKFFIV